MKQLPNGVVSIVEGEGMYAQVVQAGRHELIADEPRKQGGQDEGPNPYDFLLMALGSCTSMTIRSYARKKDIPLDSLEITLKHTHVHQDDCEHCDEEDKHLDRIEKFITLRGDLSPEQRTRLIDISKKCPVHRTLEGQKQIVTIAEGEA